MMGLSLGTAANCFDWAASPERLATDSAVDLPAGMPAYIAAWTAGVSHEKACTTHGFVQNHAVTVVCLRVVDS